MKLRKEWLLADHDEGPAPEQAPAAGRRATVAFPRALYFHDRFPYWNAFFRALRFDVRLGPESNRALAHDGIEAAVAEPCFPIQIAHGHVKAALAIQDADFVFVPNYVNAEAVDESIQSFFCPWVMTLPFVISAAPAFAAESARIVHPLIRFRGGPRALVGPLHDALRPYGVTRREIAPALTAGEAALADFRRRIRVAGADALATLASTREPAVVLIGRPYNLFDPIVNLDVPRKLRDLYGVNVVPLEFLADDDQVIEEINANMFWSYGRRILAACREAARHSDLHLIYITNFKCGPDSYIKHFVRDAFGRAFLTLQFDGHANDAGMLTRVEAYLDSQGFLRRAKPTAADLAAADTPAPAPWVAGVTFSDETAAELDAGAEGKDTADTDEAPAAPAPPRTRRPTRAPERSEVDAR